MNLSRAVFLDRDGVINEDLPYVGEVERFFIYPYVGPALKLLAEKGFSFFIVTNQSGIGRGYFKEEAMHVLHKILVEKMSEFGVEFKEIYFASNHPDTPSDERKPSPKFVLQAAEKYQLDLEKSYVIGDSPTDLELAHRAGCQAVLVRTGKGAKTEQIPNVKFDYVFDNLLDAAKVLI